MKNKLNLYECKKCKALVEVLTECKCDGCGIKCCGEEMTLVNPNSTDAVKEKHVPVYEHVEDEIVVKVGAISHVMTKEHYIMWIALVKDNIVHKVTLYPEQDVQVRFKYIPGSTIYAYCNKDGLWSSEVE